MKKSYLFILLIFILGSIILINTLFNKIRERRKGIDFTINRIELTPTNNYIFYDKNNIRLELWNYNVYKSLDIRKNDRILKKANSDTIFLYRKRHKNYELYRILLPVGF